MKKDLESRKISFEYEPIRIPYAITHTYKPDFILSNGVIVEAKGRFLGSDRTKHLKIKEQHPSLDIRFLFMKDQYLRKGSKTKYSDWCNKHGFIYAFGTSIPNEWTK